MIHPGETASVECPAGGRAHAIWATGIYTRDSSICTAAVHAGVIDFQGGGLVTIMIAGEQDRFLASTRNGVTSRPWGHWGGSFISLNGERGARVAEFEAGWGDSIEDLGLSLEVGRMVDIYCPAITDNDEVAGWVWGSGPYTSDSAICAAAQHAGLITDVLGGTVRVEILGPQPGFTGSNANRLTTEARGPSHAGFQFLGVIED